MSHLHSCASSSVGFVSGAFGWQHVDTVALALTCPRVFRVSWGCSLAVNVTCYTMTGFVFKNDYTYPLWILKTFHESSTIENGFAMSKCLFVSEAGPGDSIVCSVLQVYSTVHTVSQNPARKPQVSILCTSEQWPWLLQMHHIFVTPSGLCHLSW